MGHWTPDQMENSHLTQDRSKADVPVSYKISKACQPPFPRKELGLRGEFETTSEARAPTAKDSWAQRPAKPAAHAPTSGRARSMCTGQCRSFGESRALLIIMHNASQIVSSRFSRSPAWCQRSRAGTGAPNGRGVHVCGFGCRRSTQLRC